MDRDTLLNLSDQSVIAGRFEVLRKTEIRSTFVTYLCRDRLRGGRSAAVTLFLPEVIKEDIAARGRASLEKFLSHEVQSDLLLHPVAFINEEELLGLAIDTPDAPTLLDSDGHRGIPRSVDLGVQICRAVEAVESQGLLVREALPEDVVFVTESKIKFSYLRSALNTYLQNHGAKEEITRTLIYCAPEYIEHGTADKRIDVYLLGSLAYHAVTGLAPFDPEDRARLTARKRLNPPLARRLRKDCPLVLSNIIARAMAGDPDERHDTVTELREEFEVLRRSLSGEQISSESATKVTLSAAQAIKHQGSVEDTTSVRIERPRALWVDALLFLAGFIIITGVGMWFVNPRLLSRLVPIGSVQSLWSAIAGLPGDERSAQAASREQEAKFQRSLERIRDSINVKAPPYAGAAEQPSRNEADLPLNGEKAPPAAKLAVENASTRRPPADTFEDDRGRLLLDAAIACDDMLINKLLRDGVPINYRNSAGETALFNAVKTECVPGIKLLISRGINIDARDNDGLSAYDLAKRQGYTAGRQMLEEAGALEAPPPPKAEDEQAQN